MNEKIEFVGKCLLVKTRKKKILAFGDLHLGYEEALNRAGIFVSREIFKEMILYLNRVFKKVGKVDYIVLLGDVKHNFGSVSRQEWGDVLSLIKYLKRRLTKNGRIVIVKGNHDKILGPIVKKVDIVLEDFFIINGFCFFHGNKNFKEIHDKKIKTWILGHGHPSVKISDGVKTEKYKCFLIGNFENKKVIVVPSFIWASEGSDPRENDLGMAFNFKFNKFGVRVVSGGKLEVLNFGNLGRL